MIKIITKINNVLHFTNLIAFSYSAFNYVYLTKEKQEVNLYIIKF